MLSGFHRFQSNRIDNFRKKMIFPQMRTVLAFALSSDPRTANFCQPIDIVCFDIQLAFQLFTHIFRPRFSTESTDTQFEFFQRNAGRMNRFCQI